MLESELYSQTYRADVELEWDDMYQALSGTFGKTGSIYLFIFLLIY